MKVSIVGIDITTAATVASIAVIAAAATTAAAAAAADIAVLLRHNARRLVATLGPRGRGLLIHAIFIERRSGGYVWIYVDRLRLVACLLARS